MKLIVALLVASTTVLAQPSASPRIRTAVIDVPMYGQMGYTISVPPRASTDEPRPFVLALHPGGGSRGGPFLYQVVEPALRDWGAIIVAPDSPNRRWSEESAEQSVLFLMDEMFEQYTIDRDRVLVTGFSMGGAGTWFMATHHTERFSGAIPIASRPRDFPLDQMGSMPVHVIHSRDDERVPIGPAREAADVLRQQGNPIEFTELTRIGHYAMGGYVDSLRQAGAWMWAQWER
jgi:predicted peptidase